MAESPARVRPASNWIELFAIPIVISIMETQPIAVGLLFAIWFLSQQSGTSPLDGWSLTLLLLGLHWWAMFVKHLAQGRDERLAQPLHLLGLFVALALTIGLEIAMNQNIPNLLLSAALVIWAWRHGMEQARKGISDEQLITSFKIGFVVLLVVLVVALLYANLNTSAVLLDALAQALPLFFLSGLLALSFTRLNTIRKENASHAPVHSRVDPTRAWLVVLTLTWGAIVAGALALEIFSFQTIEAWLQPFWNFLGFIVFWLLYAIDVLLTLLLYPLLWLFPSLQQPLPAQTQQHNVRPHQAGPPPNLSVSPTLLLIGRLVLLALVLIILVLIIRAVLKRWRLAHKTDDDEEEIREGLSMGAILKARRQERQRSRQQRDAAFTLEVLDPNSARARYRELLQTIAWNRVALARRPHETPAEYQQRLQILLRKATANNGEHDDAPPDPVILAELTRAYTQERYGGRPLDQHEHSYLHKWLPDLIKRLTDSST